MRPYVWFQAEEVVDMDREVQFLLYNMPEDSGKVQVVIKDETIWCTQKAMAQLFGVGVPAVSKHLKNIFEEGELSSEMTISKMETIINRGKRGEVNEFIDFYNLDAIIAVGYRVSSLKATRFRQWATKILNEYIRKGFAMDDERLKQGPALFGKDYFRELLEEYAPSEQVSAVSGSRLRIYMLSAALTMTATQRPREISTQWSKTVSTTP